MLGFTPSYSKLTQGQRSTADLPMERFTLDASGPQGSSTTDLHYGVSKPWKAPAPIFGQDLPMERFTLGDWALPLTTRFSLCNLFSLPYSKLWCTLVGTAPCAHSVYKAAHSQDSVVSTASPSSFSPRQVSACHRSCVLLVPFYWLPRASFCKDLLSLILPMCIQQRMKFSGSACKSLNKLIHSLNANYVCFETHTPKFRSVSWKNSFTLPNGMIVFDYSFYGKNKLWVKYFRRGSTYEIDTDRSSSTRLYGIMLRSIASRGGGPGSRWTYLQAYGRSWKCSARKDVPQVQGQNTPIYSMEDLHYSGPCGHDDIYTIDDCDDIYIFADFPLAQLAQNHSVQCGYQDRRTLRGTSRGYRSEASFIRRWSSWRNKQQEARRDFRQLKASCKDASLRTHGGQKPNPLICPKPAVYKRLLSQSRIFTHGYNQLCNVNKSVAIPVPTGFQLQLATWNVEGLREAAKYDQIRSLLNSKRIHLLAVQETKCESVSE